MPVVYLLEKTHKDLNTITGQNSRYILDQIDATNIFDVKPNEVKKSVKFENLPEEEEWKVDLIKNVTDVKHVIMVLTKPSDDDNEETYDDTPPIEFTCEEMDEILYYVCTS